MESVVEKRVKLRDTASSAALSSRKAIHRAQRDSRSPATSANQACGS